jgi:lipid A 4'-phosphatase
MLRPPGRFFGFPDPADAARWARADARAGRDGNRMTETRTPDRPDADPMFLWPFARISTAVALTVLIVAALVFFRFFPGIDIGVSQMFFEATACAAGKVCGTFPLSATGWVAPIRQSLQATPVILAIGLLVIVLARVFVRRAGIDSFNAAALAAVLSLVLGAGVVVNMLLKEFSGRPRPIMTDLFGGPFPFVPAGQFSDHCAGNCSFVSGEAAGAFWLVGLAALAPLPYRMPAMAVAFCAATLTSFLRIAFGGHYLSDVIIAALVSLLVFSIVSLVVRGLASTSDRKQADYLRY